VIDHIDVTAVRHMLFDAAIRLLHANLIPCINAPIRPA
jgi:hypothetical protein